MTESDSNYNSLIFLMLAGGYYYLSNRKKNGGGEGGGASTPEDKEFTTYHLPVAVAAFVVYSLREEIQQTITADRLLLGVAMSLSNYVIENEGGALKASVASLATLILGPAITAEKK